MVVRSQQAEVKSDRNIEFSRPEALESGHITSSSKLGGSMFPDK